MVMRYMGGGAEQTAKTVEGEMATPMARDT